MPVTMWLLHVHGNQEFLGVGPVCDMGLPRFQQCRVVVKGTVQLGFRRKSWIEAGGTEEVECDSSMGDEAVPEMQGEVVVAATEASNEAIVVGLDVAFCGVGVMKVWRNELELYAGIAQELF